MSEPSHHPTIDLLTHITSLMNSQELRFHERIDALEKSVEQSLHAAEKAILKAETATERRLEGLNELRAVTEDRAKEFMPRAVAESFNQRLDTRIDELQLRHGERISELQSRLDRLEGSSIGIKSGWGYLVAGVTLVATIFTIFYALAK